MELLH